MDYKIKLIQSLNPPLKPGDRLVVKEVSSNSLEPQIINNPFIVVTFVDKHSYEDHRHSNDLPLYNCGDPYCPYCVIPS